MSPITTAKRSAELLNAIVWFERQPGVTGVVRTKYNPVRHAYPTGQVKIINSDNKRVRVRVYDKTGLMDIYVNAVPSKHRDRWISLCTTGDPFGQEQTEKARLTELKESIQKRMADAATPIAVPKPEGNIVTHEAAVTMNVGPDLAAKWLETNTRNRKLRQSVVNRYAADMKAGLWMKSPDAIAFDINGAVINGQHRLWAVLEAGVTVPMTVMFDMDPDTVNVLDDHLKRNMADVVNIRRPGSAVTGRHTSIAKMLMETSIMANSVDRSKARDRVSRQMEMDMLDHHWDAINFVLRDCLHSGRVRSVTVAATLTPMVRAYYSQDKDRLRAFGKALVRGVVEDKSDNAVLKLRNWLMGNGAMRGVRATSEVIYRKTERALKAFLEGDAPEKMYEASEELFPLPDDRAPRR